MVELDGKSAVTLKTSEQNNWNQCVLVKCSRRKFPSLWHRNGGNLSENHIVVFDKRFEKRCRKAITMCFMVWKFYLSVKLGSRWNPLTCHSCWFGNFRNYTAHTAPIGLLWSAVTNKLQYWKKIIKKRK